MSVSCTTYSFAPVELDFVISACASFTSEPSSTTSAACPDVELATKNSSEPGLPSSSRTASASVTPGISIVIRLSPS